jgi:hypothetical protein
LTAAADYEKQISIGRVDSRSTYKQWNVGNHQSVVLSAAVGHVRHELEDASFLISHLAPVEPHVDSVQTHPKTSRLVLRDHVTGYVLVDVRSQFFDVELVGFFALELGHVGVIEDVDFEVRLGRRLHPHVVAVGVGNDGQFLQESEVNASPTAAILADVEGVLTEKMMLSKVSVNHIAIIPEKLSRKRRTSPDSTGKETRVNESWRCGR